VRHPELYSFLALGGPRVVETEPAVAAEEPPPVEPVVAEVAPEPEPEAPAPVPAALVTRVRRPFRLDSTAIGCSRLFTPSASDTVDWSRGNYTVLSRSGRVDSPAGSGELKKQLKHGDRGIGGLPPASEPRGGAADVAPDGFAHPVFSGRLSRSLSRCRRCR